MLSCEPSEHAAAFLLSVSLQTVQMRRQVVPARMSLWELAHAATTSAVPSPKDSATRNRQGAPRLPRVGHTELGHLAPYLKPHVNRNHSTSTPSLGRLCNDSNYSCTPYDQNITHYCCDAAISLNWNERLASPKRQSLEHRRGTHTNISTRSTPWRLNI